MEKQQTPLQEAIKKAQGDLEFYKIQVKSNVSIPEMDFFKGSISATEQHLGILRSLLPKEQNSHIDFAAAYKNDFVQSDSFKSPRTFFNEYFETE